MQNVAPNLNFSLTRPMAQPSVRCPPVACEGSVLTDTRNPALLLIANPQPHRVHRRLSQGPMVRYSRRPLPTERVLCHTTRSVPTLESPHFLCSGAGVAAHLSTGREEECARTVDTNPGCNYLVRGYSPYMHFFLER